MHSRRESSGFNRERERAIKEAAAAGGGGGGGGGEKLERRPSSTLMEIQRLQNDRDERRRLMEQVKVEKAAEAALNLANGTPGDIDFQRMIKVYRDELNNS